MRTIEYLKWLDGENVVRIRLSVERGQVVGFVTQLEGYFDGQWWAIVRYDTAHGYAHRDLLRPDGTVEKTTLNAPDFNAALSFAESDIVDNWAAYRRSYERWLKE